MMKKIWIYPIIFALLIPIGNAQPTPVNVYGYVYDADGIPLPDGITVVVKNIDTGEYANTTTFDGAYLSFTSASIGDMIMASVSYLGENASNTTMVQDRLLQLLDISLPLSENQNPIANAGSHYAGRPNESITFDASGSYDPDGDTLYYQWKFDGNWTSWTTMATESYIYSNIGQYNISLGVTDGNGAYDSDNTTVTISNVSPIANFTYEPLNPTEGIIIQFIDRSTDPQNDIIIWEWDFGDGGTSNMQNPFYLYSNGIYDVTLEVTDTNSHSDSITKSITVGNGGDDDDDEDNETKNASECLLLNVNTDKVEYNIGEIVDISLETTNLCNQSINVTFPTTQTYDFKIINESDGEVYRWSHNKSFDQAVTTIIWSPGETRWNNISWNQTDNNWSVVPTGEYRIAGWLPGLNITFENDTTIMIVNKSEDDENGNGEDNGTENETINANFTYMPSDPTVGTIVQFNDTSTGNISSWLWDFADGTNATDRNMSHSFDAAGDYSVNLTVSNATQSDFITKIVSVLVVVHNETFNLIVNVEGAEQSTIQILQNDEIVNERAGPSATFTLESGIYDIKVLSSKGEKTMTVDLAGDTIKTVDFDEKDTPIGFGVVIAGLVIAMFLYGRKRNGKRK